MKTKLLLLLTLAFSVCLDGNSRQYFNKNTDLLLANFDLKPDEDDVHAAAALASMLIHPDLAGVDYYAVAGAYGTQGGTFITTAVPGYYNNLFGPENQKWTNANANWSASVNRVRDKVKAVLDGGGKVFVQEAGQSDFTYDMLQAVINAGVSLSTVQSKVIVVQHSQWNEDKATQWKLNWVKNNTDYNKIADGNGNNATPQYNTGNTTWMNQAKSASNPNASARSFWTQADNICDNWNASWENPNIAGGGVDYSDCVENWWIFNIGTDADNISKFWNRYVVNTPSGGGAETVSCSSLPSSIQSSTSITVSVPYSANQSRDVVVEFWDNNWIASGKTTVSAGSGTASVTINLPSAPAAGSNYIFKVSIRPVGGNWTTNIDFCQKNNVTVTTGGSGQSPYGGSAWTIPGRVEAQDYDLGGEGVAYHDTDASNNGGAYRTDGVDIETTGDTNGAYNVGWMQPGEWLEYTVNVNTTQSYHFYARVASINGNGQFRILVDGSDVSGTLNVNNTGGWQSYYTITVPNVTMSSGQHVVRIEVISSGLNLNFWSAWKSPGARFDNTTITEAPTFEANAFPNPLPPNQLLNVDLTLTEKADLKMELVAMDGRVVFADQVSDLQQGQQLIKLDPRAQALKPGLYLLRVSAGEYNKQIRIKL
ncbi:carbohydrate-binding protein [Marinoscillum furvescens]|uniref:Putative secreted protein (Por secretion system target) n=1 Tax=Marinoscillum furvescens DSM 4134 TaxID=1122208 RepID=A0A3D9L6K6_MARFU|nr:carbohydrate-binding protein [Marinoscillum furvescens]REE00207.1 putative secreted protein (Por secretion system target) [Marinoscillum furvescens DSM 4134]